MCWWVRCKNVLNVCKTRKDRFSRLARPLQHQRTLINWGDANSQWAKEGGSFEECDAAKPRKSVMQLTQVLNAQKKVHNKRESVLQLKLLGAGPWGYGSKPAVRLIFDPEVRRELSPYPWSGRREQPPCPDSSNPFGGKTVCVNREWASPKDTCDIGWCVRIAVSREEQMLWSTCGCSQGKRCDGTYNTYRWRANTRKWDTHR